MKESTEGVRIIISNKLSDNIRVYGLYQKKCLRPI